LLTEQRQARLDELLIEISRPWRDFDRAAGFGGVVGGQDGGEGVPVIGGFVFGGAAGAEGFDEVALGLGEAVLVGVGAGEAGAEVARS
jgi:hypothetical protein